MGEELTNQIANATPEVTPVSEPAPASDGAIKTIEDLKSQANDYLKNNPPDLEPRPEAKQANAESELAKAVEEKKIVEEIEKEKEVQQSEEPKEVQEQEAIADASLDQELSGEAKPDLTYKVYDQEKKFPDWLSTYVNKENEQQFRDLLTKADGLEEIKPKLNKYREESAHLKQQMGTASEELKFIFDAKQKGDLYPIMDAFKITPDDIKRFAIRLAEQDMLTPEQKQSIEEARNFKTQNFELSKMYQETQAQLQEIKANQYSTAISSVIEQPIHADFVKNMVSINPDTYEQVKGKDAFWQEIRQIGAAHYMKHGYDMPVQDAINIVFKKYDYDPAKPKQDNTSTTVKKTIQTVVTNKQKTIPNMGSSAIPSASKAKITSTDDLRNMAKEYSAR